MYRFAKKQEQTISKTCLVGHADIDYTIIFKNAVYL